MKYEIKKRYLVKFFSTNTTLKEIIVLETSENNKYIKILESNGKTPLWMDVNKIFLMDSLNDTEEEINNMLNKIEGVLDEL